MQFRDAHRICFYVLVQSPSRTKTSIDRQNVNINSGQVAQRTPRVPLHSGWWEFLLLRALAGMQQVVAQCLFSVANILPFVVKAQKGMFKSHHNFFFKLSFSKIIRSIIVILKHFYFNQALRTLTSQSLIIPNWFALLFHHEDKVIPFQRKDRYNTCDSEPRGMSFNLTVRFTNLVLTLHIQQGVKT